MTNDPSILCAPSERAILRIVPVRVHRGVEAFVAEVERGRTILARCGVEAEIRVWRATYAGADTGTVLVTLEFADQVAFHRSERAFAGAPQDAEFHAWSRALPEFRSVLSDSLHVELTNSR